jgi:AsmA-like C-terminal region
MQAPPNRPKRILKWAAIVLLGGLAVIVALLATHWPFRRGAVIKALREQAEGNVTIGNFHQTFFPRPGCVARSVTIRHGSDASAPPLITVERLTIAGDYSALLTFSKGKLDEIRAEGMHIRIPSESGASGNSADAGSSSEPLLVRRFIAERVVLEFAPKEATHPPFVIQIHEAVLSPASATTTMQFETSLRIPEPAGEVRAKGKFGPWAKANPYRTPVSGTYTFAPADLGTFRGLAGKLASTGRFEGTIDGIDVSGDTDVPDFEITGTSQRLHLRTQFRATVNGKTGSVELHRVDARFLHTDVISEGTVDATKDDDPKTVALDMRVNDGRIQDLLRLVSSGPPGLTGVVSLRFRVGLPPGDRPFLEKLRLNGDIGVGGARFTEGGTQQELEHISRNAEHGDENPADVVSDLQGHVSVANGVATLTNVRFRVPGASAAMSGTYHLITRTVDLRGTVYVQEKLSQTTKGIKSFLLKALDPFFRKKKHLSVVPVRITGTYGHTSVGLNLR